jgi:hypothetical protein
MASEARPRRFALLLVAAGAAVASAVSLPAAPNASNVLVLATYGATATLYEYATSGGQAAAVQFVSLTGCNLGTGMNQAYGANSANGAYALFPCGLGTTATRVIARVAPSGYVDLTTSYTSAGVYLPRGVASPDGGTIYAADGLGIFSGGFGGTLSALNEVGERRETGGGDRAWSGQRHEAHAAGRGDGVCPGVTR